MDFSYDYQSQLSCKK